MSSLMDLVAQNQPKFQTHQALLVIGMQNDFLLPDGRLPVNVKKGFLERIQTLIPKFRELNGNVIWVQTLYEADRIASDPNTGEGDALVVGGLIDGDESSTEGGDDEPATPVKEAKDLPPAQSRSSKHKQRALDLLKRVSARRKNIPQEVAKATAEEDDELFLLKSEKKSPACVPNTFGAEFADVIARQFELPADSVIRTTNYSAFQGTNLLMTLRARLVTELYICGCITNVSVLATVIDAARHGVKINVVQDCLGYRKQARHDLALKRMDEFFDAYLVDSVEILAREPAVIEPPPSSPPTDPKSGSKGNDKSVGGRLSQIEEARPTSRTSSPRSPTAKSDKDFSDMLVKGATVPGAEDAEAEQDKPKLVKTKIRMRSKEKRKKKREKEREEDASKDKTGATAPTLTATAKPPPPATDPQRTSWIAKAGSVMDLREKDSRPQSLKSVASVPALSAKNEEKDRNRLSDLSDRVRLSLSRAPKSESSESKKSIGGAPTKAAAKTAPSKVVETKTEQSSAKPTEKTVVPSAAPLSKASKVPSLATLPVLGPNDTIGEGDSHIIYDLFPLDLHHPTDPSKLFRDVIFARLYNEIQWQKMLHQQGEVPRLVCCQGAFGDDGSMPVYRHPSDQTLPLLHFSPNVHFVRKQAEKVVGHPLNHVLIQLYRSGNDYISEHSDKTLDIVAGSSIANVSFGAQRTMRLRTKRTPSTTTTTNTPHTNLTEPTQERTTQRIPLLHNSLFTLGPLTNATYLHGIMPDKRLPSDRSTAEQDYNGMRISLTFRHIGTFIDASETIIWGRGATAKEQRDAADVINGDDEESEMLVRAFGKENAGQGKESWEDWYGAGSDVLHLHTQSETSGLPMLFLSGNDVEDKQVKICLAEAKVKYTTISNPAPELEDALDHGGNDKCRKTCRVVSFRDRDTHHTQVSSASSILLYLDRYHPLDPSTQGRLSTARAYEILRTAESLQQAWRAVRTSNVNEEHAREGDVDTLLSELEEQIKLHGGPFIAGNRFSIADAAVWPVLDGVLGGREMAGYDMLRGYWEGTWRKKGCVKKFKESLGVKNTALEGLVVGERAEEEAKEREEDDGPGKGKEIEVTREQKKEGEVKLGEKGEEGVSTLAQPTISTIPGVEQDIKAKSKDKGKSKAKAIATDVNA
ncbi:hypothetical protein T440DRAFT_409520 [Plenodomus tracheiphilus IPT5]|uniref:Fe2OG dioxygenase domain-containing protein n=1 Tax=Plenodomus tracheiphilus IPT5 TaxID=1408161 RepID=A0A6A7ANR5_9PLEO|nr:hypothetical protein T440DRAFT_409520 [Plenodomus tracheiphilus IPT5]